MWYASFYILATSTANWILMRCYSWLKQAISVWTNAIGCKCGFTTERWGILGRSLCFHVVVVADMPSVSLPSNFDIHASMCGSLHHRTISLRSRNTLRIQYTLHIIWSRYAIGYESGFTEERRGMLRRRSCFGVITMAQMPTSIISVSLPSIFDITICAHVWKLTRWLNFPPK